jgi:hypothetical protein
MGRRKPWQHQAIESVPELSRRVGDGRFGPAPELEQEAGRCQALTWMPFGRVVCDAPLVDQACPVSPHHARPDNDHYDKGAGR